MAKSKNTISNSDNLFETKIYSQLVEQLVRLQKIINLDNEQVKATINSLFTDLIYSKVEDSEILKELKKSKQTPKIIEMPDVLNNKYFLSQASKILGLLEVSKHWKEFEKLNSKLKKEKEPVEFDKILKAIMKVPK